MKIAEQRQQRKKNRSVRHAIIISSGIIRTVETVIIRIIVGTATTRITVENGKTEDRTTGTEEMIPNVPTITEIRENAANRTDTEITDVTVEITTEEIIRMDQTVENKTEVTIHSQERLDELHRNGYRIIQDPGRFCFGMDAVLLSGFAKVKRGERALDLGTGTGIIPILLEAKTAGEHLQGWKFSPRVRIWQNAVSLTIIWKTKLTL